MKVSEEIRIKLDELQEAYNKECSSLIEQHAKDNNPYKVGDILQDHYQIGEVVSVIISTHSTHRTYDITYRCKRLTKKLTPYRDGEPTHIWLGNVENKIE